MVRIMATYNREIDAVEIYYNGGYGYAKPVSLPSFENSDECVPAVKISTALINAEDLRNLGTDLIGIADILSREAP